MIQNETMLAIVEASEHRRAERRRFLKVAGGGAAAVGGLSLLAACGDDDGGFNPTPTPSPTPTPTPTSSSAQQDINVLNFALNLEYLEATFYSYAAFGSPLSPALTSGIGNVGTVTGGRKVNFSDPIVAKYAREIAGDEVAHVNFLRSALGSAAIALPDLNIDGGSTGAFTAAARAAGLVSSSGTFDPYADDQSFLLGAFIFEDVGVTAYKGGSTLISNKTYLEAAAGILAAEAYHAGLVRTLLYAKGMTTRSATDSISNARDSLDGTTDLDQGTTGPDSSQSNIVPTDSNGIAFSRTVAQVHNIAYLTNKQASSGGFFPTGTRNANPALTQSGAN
ncbi:conserved hypothetical protein [Sphingomonas sp. EC-HK361]|uniref:ferritin-like domain-containing protein n=1 Tax=Sphingomonas sp. EC-HK361 TaxID=2038397 RepID=UPI0012559B0F|nr:ferritin-like domain-containing protein [Sphingomonas sp. EC-HK361]VVS96317.1 conserved hypothetical protein [Sphingomonas sp. EC-HK361]